MGSNVGETEISRVIEAFRAFDVDQNGRIDRQELARLLWTLNPDFDESMVSAMYNALDQNNDGKIDYEEFVCWLFCDDKTRSKLWIASVEERSSPIPIKVALADGHTVIMQVSPQTVVRDLRLRACMALCVPVERLCDFELHSRGETLVPTKRTFELKNRELTAKLACRAGGLILAASGMQVSCYRLESLRKEADLDAPGKVHHLFHAAEPGVIIAVCSNLEIAVWDDGNHRKLWEAHLDMQINSVATGFASVYASTEDGIIIAWAARTGQQMWRQNVANTLEGVRRLLCVEPCQFLCIGTDAGKVIVWEGQTGQEVWRRQHGGAMPEIDHLVSKPDGSAVFSGDINACLVAWEIRTGSPLWQVNLGCMLHSLVYHAETESLYAASNAGNLIAVSLRKGSETLRLQLHPDFVAAGPGCLLFIAVGSTIRALNASRGCKEVWATDVKSSIQSLVYLAEGDTVLAVSNCGGMVLLTASTGTCIARAVSGQRFSAHAHQPRVGLPPVMKAASEARLRAAELIHAAPAPGTSPPGSTPTPATPTAGPQVESLSQMPTTDRPESVAGRRKQPPLPLQYNDGGTMTRHRSLPSTTLASAHSAGGYAGGRIGPTLPVGAPGRAAPSGLGLGMGATASERRPGSRLMLQPLEEDAGDRPRSGPHGFHYDRRPAISMGMGATMSELEEETPMVGAGLRSTKVLPAASMGMGVTMSETRSSSRLVFRALEEEAAIAGAPGRSRSAKSRTAAGMGATLSESRPSSRALLRSLEESTPLGPPGHSRPAKSGASAGMGATRSESRPGSRAAVRSLEDGLMPIGASTHSNPAKSGASTGMGATMSESRPGSRAMMRLFEQDTAASTEAGGAVKETRASQPLPDLAEDALDRRHSAPPVASSSSSPSSSSDASHRPASSSSIVRTPGAVSLPPAVQATPESGAPWVVKLSAYVPKSLGRPRKRSAD